MFSGIDCVYILNTQKVTTIQWYGGYGSRHSPTFPFNVMSGKQWGLACPGWMPSLQRLGEGFRTLGVLFLPRLLGSNSVQQVVAPRISSNVYTGRGCHHETKGLRRSLVSTCSAILRSMGRGLCRVCSSIPIPRSMIFRRDIPVAKIGQQR